MREDQIQILSDLCTLVAKRDASQPDPANLRNGWRTDALLQNIDSLVVIQYNDPIAYAEIGRRVLAKISDLPEMAALAQLVILRGMRLLPNAVTDEEPVLQLMDTLDITISSLPEGTRKLRCESLLKYHMGIFYEACGRFDLAANIQKCSAEKAKQLGDVAGMSIAYYSMARDQLKAALCAGATAGKLHVLFLAQEQSFAKLAEDLRGSALEIQWVQGTCPVHMIQACIWLDYHNHPRWKEWVSMAVATADKLGNAWEPIAKFVLAADMDHRGDTQADEALHAIARNNKEHEIKATAILILTRRAVRKGQPSNTQTLPPMPVEGAQHILACAQRMLPKI
jgi:hypothetical protein